MKHLSLFNSTSEYNSFVDSDEFIMPNVSYVKGDNKVYYNPLVVRNNVITYQANSKLPETTSTGTTSGLHVNAFNSPIVSHEFADGIGTITFEEDITSIGNYAFYNCSGMTGELVIPDSVTTIGNYAFYGCSGMTGELVIPDSVTTIGKYAFYNCSGMTGEFVIPDSVTSIGERAFTYCYGLTSVTIGSGVTSIGNSAFSNCTGLTGELVIPDSVTSIGGSVFFGCTLSSLIVNCNVPSADMSSSPFYAGTYSYVEFGSGVTSIGSYAFYQSSLISITIPDSVTKIGSGAFYNCHALTGITCHAVNAPSIQSNTFLNVKKGGILYVPAGSIENYTTWMKTSSDYLGIYDWFIQETGNELPELTLDGYDMAVLVQPLKTTASTKIFGSSSSLSAVTEMSVDGVVVDTPATVYTFSTAYDWHMVRYKFVDKTIPISALTDCSRVKEIVIGNSVISIEKEAFRGCSGSTEVTIGSGVTEIGESAFRDCSRLTGITIPDSVTSIGDYTFINCSRLTGELVIPDSVTSIGNYAFSNCSGMTGTLIIPDSVTSIGDYTFNNCPGLTDITIGSGVTSIGERAFYQCSGLTEVTISDSVTSIGISAFTNCYGLTGITIPDSVTSIGNSAFRYCDGLTEVTIGSGVTSIGSSVFQSCSSLSNIVISSGNTVYDSRENCNCIIEKATNTLIEGCNNSFIPDSVITIGSYAFAYCKSLTGITIPDSVTSIGEWAFGYCSGLTEMTCHALVAPSIQSNTFYRVKSNGVLYVPSGASGYDTWMGTGSYYLGKYNWTKQEMS